MILRTVDLEDEFYEKNYEIPDEVGAYILGFTKSTKVVNPCSKFSADFLDLLFIISKEVSADKADITFYLTGSKENAKT